MKRFTARDLIDGKKNAREQAQERFEGLVALYPRDLVREMVKEYQAQQDAETVPMSDAAKQELDAVLAKSFDDAETDARNPEELAELQKMRTLFDVSSPPTPEEEAIALEEEVNTAIRNVLSSWVNVLYLAHRPEEEDESRPFILPLTDTLEPVTPISFLDQPDMIWQETPCNSIAMTPEQVGKLHEAFAAKLRPLIDAAGPNGYVLLTEDLVITKTDQGYCLTSGQTS